MNENNHLIQPSCRITFPLQSFDCHVWVVACDGKMLQSSFIEMWTTYWFNLSEYIYQWHHLLQMQSLIQFTAFGHVTNPNISDIKLWKCDLAASVDFTNFSQNWLLCVVLKLNSLQLNPGLTFVYICQEVVLKVYFVQWYWTMSETEWTDIKNSWNQSDCNIIPCWVRDNMLT